MNISLKFLDDLIVTNNFFGFCIIMINDFEYSSKFQVVMCDTWFTMKEGSHTLGISKKSEVDWLIQILTEVSILGCCNALEHYCVSSM